MELISLYILFEVDFVIKLHTERDYGIISPSITESFINIFIRLEKVSK